jgi:hypothetical protein
MMVLSALEFGSAAYGSARDRQFKRLEPVHNKGLRIAIEAFCVCTAQNILCESGYESLAERRRRKTIKTARQTSSRNGANHRRGGTARVHESVH